MGRTMNAPPSVVINKYVPREKMGADNIPTARMREEVMRVDPRRPQARYQT
jgi:hypothetical protein